LTSSLKGYRGLPATLERIAGHSGCGDHLVARSSWGQDAPESWC
jgi:glutamate carboxypeptidase